MNSIEKYILQFAILFFAFYVAPPSGAGQVRAVASTDKNVVSPGEHITVLFCVENETDVQQFIPPSFKDCIIVEGPIQNSGMFVVQGPVNRYVSFKYIIQPQKPGNYQLSGAFVKISNRRLPFNPIRFHVKDSQQTNNRYDFSAHADETIMDQQLYSDFIVRKGEDVETKIRQNLFIRVEASKSHCYEGEPLIATYTLYSRLSADSKVSRRPSLTGFSVYDMVDPATVTPSVEYWNGRLFNTFLIRKVQLFPLHSGVLQLDPAEVDNAVTFITDESSTDERQKQLPELLRSGESNNLLQSGVLTRQVRTTSKPLFVTVLPLPDSARPASFDGAVGNFSIEASIDKNEVTTGDAAVLKVMIKGDGNFDVINAPKIHWPKDVDAYEPDINENILRTEVPMRGYKIFSFTVVPKRVGYFSIPPVEFSFFDPQTASYRIEQSQAIGIHSVSLIRDSKTYSPTVADGDSTKPPVVNNYWLAVFAAVVFLCLFFCARYIRFNRKRQPKSPEVRGSKELISVPFEHENPSSVFWDGPLFRARLMLVQRDGQGFYGELSKVLWQKMLEKLQLTGSASDPRDIIQRMKEKGMDDITIMQFQLLIQQCDMALYTPVTNEAEMQSVFDLAEDLLESISKK